MNKQKLKTALVIWLSIYPLITITFYFFGPNLMQLALPLRTLVLTGVLVPTMVFVMVPLITRILQRFFGW